MRLKMINQMVSLLMINTGTRDIQFIINMANEKYIGMAGLVCEV